MKLFLTIFIAFTCLTALAQTDSLRVQYDKGTVQKRSFNQQDLESFRQKEAFNYDVVLEKKRPKHARTSISLVKTDGLRFLEWIFGVHNATGILAVILRILPYLIAGLVLFLLLKFFLKVNANALVQKGENTGIVDFVEAEDLMQKINIQELIGKAIAHHNYRLAIRYHYILILQGLEASKAIVWEQQKTNVDYIREIKNTGIKADFKQLTWVYDMIWYGNFEINQTDFLKVQQEFGLLTKAIKLKL